jgi:hypothetical protein
MTDDKLWLLGMPAGRSDAGEPSYGGAAAADPTICDLPAANGSLH